LSQRRFTFSHDHHACDLVLFVKHETVIQIGEDALQSFLNGQVIEGHTDLFLEKSFISPEPDARLLLDVPCYLQKRCLLEVHGEKTVFDAHRLSTQTILTKEEAKEV